MHKRSKWLVYVTLVVAVLVVWTLASLLLSLKDTGGINLLPMPHLVLVDLFNLLVHERFWLDILQSILRILCGVLAAMIPAFILGFWFGSSEKVYAIAGPLFAFSKYIPPVSFVPILILWLGIGLKQQIALLFIGIFFYLTTMTANTVRETPKAFIDASRTLGLGERQILFKVLVPHALPRLINHLQEMVAIAWTYLVVVEMVAAPNGIGRVIINSQRFLETGNVIAGMLTIGVLGVLTDQFLRGLSRLLCSWEETHA